MSNKAKIGAKIVLDGEKEFNAAVKSCNKNLGSIRSELNLVKEKYTSNANSLEALRAKHDILTKKLEEERNKLGALRAGYDHAVGSQKKVETGLIELKAKYSVAQTEMERMRRSSTATDAELKKQEDLMKQLSVAIEKGEQNYRTAGDRVQNWKNKINTAEASVIKATKALKVNDTYLEEARKSTNHCATSIDNFGKKIKKVETVSVSFKDQIKANLTSTAIISGLRSLEQGIQRVGTSAVNTAREAALYADDMNTLATQTGVSTQALQEMKYMEDLVDVSLETATKSMAKNIKSMSNAKSGSAAYAKAYKKLGVSIIDANGNMRDSEEVYWDTIYALGDMQNATERDATAMQIFGKSAQNLNPLISAGRDGIEAFRQEAQRVGAVLDQNTLDALNETNDQFDRLDQQSQALKRELGASLAPSILSAATEIGTAIQENKKELIGLADDGIDLVTTGLKWIIQHAQGVVAAVAGIASAYVTLKVAIKAADIASNIASLASMATPIGATIAAVGLLASGFLALKTALSGNNKETSQELVAMKETTKALQEKNSAIEQSITAAKEKVSSAESEVYATEQQAKRLEELNKVENKSEAQKREMTSLVESLSGQIDGLKENYDAETGQLKMSNKQIEQKIQNYKKLYLTQAAEEELKETYKQQYQAQRNIDEANKEIEKSTNRVAEAEEKARKATEAWKNEAAENVNNPTYNENNSEKFQKAIYEEQQYLLIKDQENEAQKELNKTLKESKKSLSACKEQIEGAESYIKKFSQTSKKEGKKSGDAYKSLANAFSSSEKEVEKSGKKMSSTTKKQFDYLVKAAKKTGTKFPKSLATGLKNGSISPETAVEKINSKIQKNLLNLVDKAKKNGVSIPKELAEKIRNGSIDVDTAYKRINKYIKKESNQQIQWMEKAGLVISDEIKAGYEKGGWKAVDVLQTMRIKIDNLMREAGASSVEGLLAGIKNKIPAVVAAFEKFGLDFNRTGINTGKKLSKGMDSQKKKVEKSSKNLGKSVAKGLKSSKSEVKKSAAEIAEEAGQKRITNLQNKIEMKDLKTNGKGYNERQIKKYWKKVVNATKTGTSAHKEALKEYYQARNELINQQKEALKELRTSYKEEIKELKASLKEAKAEAQEQIKELRETYNESIKSTQESITNTWGLFSKAEITKTNNADGLIRNMQTQVDAIEQWRKNLSALRKKGVSEDLIKDLESAGLSSAGDVSTMASMSSAQLKQYQELYKKRSSLALQESKTQNAALQAETNKQIKAIQADLKKKQKELQAATKKAIAALSKTYRQDMKKLGTSVSEGFANGIQKSSNKVYQAIAKLTGQTVKQVKKNLKINSPSRVMDELGGYTGLGFVQGLQRETENMHAILTEALQERIQAPKATVDTGAVAAGAGSGDMKPVNLCLYMDSREVAAATFNTLDLIQGANIQLRKRGITRP